VVIEPASRKTPHDGQLFFEADLSPEVTLSEELVQKDFVGIKVLKFSIAAEKERLFHGILESVMALLNVAIFIPRCGIGSLGRDAVMPEKPLIAGRKLLGVTVFIDGRS
jgi:hypothetical protein